VGGAAPTILNAANEVAVEAFLARKIGFSEIARVVEAALTQCESPGRAPASINEALAIDTAARACAIKQLTN
jgi:1-deoxy-D-xylulose-5-phosphate reductoisomerase